MGQIDITRNDVIKWALAIGYVVIATLRDQMSYKEAKTALLILVLEIMTKLTEGNE